MTNTRIAGLANGEQLTRALRQTVQIHTYARHIRALARQASSTIIVPSEPRPAPGTTTTRAVLQPRRTLHVPAMPSYIERAIPLPRPMGRSLAFDHNPAVAEWLEGRHGRPGPDPVGSC